MLRRYIGVLLDYAGWRLALALGLLALVGLTEGIGLLMLVPFLGLEAVWQKIICILQGLFSAWLSVPGSQRCRSGFQNL